MRDGSVIVIVSDGVLNAYATPEAAVHAMARQLWDIRKARRNPAKREEAMPLLQAAKGDHAALKILREAEKAANERKPHDHLWNLGCVFQRFQRQSCGQGTVMSRPTSHGMICRSACCSWRCGKMPLVFLFVRETRWLILPTLAGNG